MAGSVNVCLLLLLLAHVFTAARAVDFSREVKNPAGCSPERQTAYGDRLTVDYRLTLQADGAEIDSGKDFTFKHGDSRLIKGWTRGLEEACVGENLLLTVPPELGYGAKGKEPVIPGGSVLVFEMSLKAIARTVRPSPLENCTEEEAAAAGGGKNETVATYRVEGWLAGCRLDGPSKYLARQVVTHRQGDDEASRFTRSLAKGMEGACAGEKRVLILSAGMATDGTEEEKEDDKPGELLPDTPVTLLAELVQVD